MSLIYKLQVLDICRSTILISIISLKAWIFSQTQSWTQGVRALTQQYPKYHFKEVMNSTSPQVFIEFSFKVLYHFQLNLAAWKEEPLQPQQHSGQDLLLGNFEVRHCVTSDRDKKSGIFSCPLPLRGVGVSSTIIFFQFFWNTSEITPTVKTRFAHSLGSLSSIYSSWGDYGHGWIWQSAVGPAWEVRMSILNQL